MFDFCGTGTGCNSEGTSCTTGGPIWDGRTPFSRAEFSFVSTVVSASSEHQCSYRPAFPLHQLFESVNEVTYSLSNLYGMNVGIVINTTDPSCPMPGCGQVEANGGCVSFLSDTDYANIFYSLCASHPIALQPVIGPEGAGERSCFSPCCSSAADCENGALVSGGCVDNVGLGPNTGFHHNRCPNLIS